MFGITRKALEIVSALGIGAGAVVTVPDAVDKVSTYVKERQGYRAAPENPGDGVVSKKVKTDYPVELKVSGPSQVEVGGEAAYNVEFDTGSARWGMGLVVGVDDSAADILVDERKLYKRWVGETLWRDGDFRRFDPFELITQSPAYKDAADRFREEITGKVDDLTRRASVLKDLLGQQEMKRLTDSDGTFPAWLFNPRVEKVSYFMNFAEGSAGLVGWSDGRLEMPIRFLQAGRVKVYGMGDVKGARLSGELAVVVGNPEAEKPQEKKEQYGLTIKIPEKIEHGRTNEFEVVLDASESPADVIFIAGIDGCLGQVDRRRIKTEKMVAGETDKWLRAESSDYGPVSQFLSGKEWLESPGVFESEMQKRQAQRIRLEQRVASSGIPLDRWRSPMLVRLLENTPLWLYSDQTNIAGPIHSDFLSGEEGRKNQYGKIRWTVPVRTARDLQGNGKFGAYVYILPSETGIFRESVIEAENGSGNHGRAVEEVVEMSPADQLQSLFRSPATYAAGQDSVMVAVDDLDNDGTPDLVVPNDLSDGLAILINDRKGGFKKRTAYRIYRPNFAAIGDFNNDGNPDIAATSWSEPTVYILLGDGTGAFTHYQNFRLLDDHRSIGIGDFNRDRNLDLAINNQNSNGVAVLFGDGHGSFGNRRDFAVGAHPVSIAVADLNRDGNQDLLTANAASDNLSILIGNGKGGFSPSRDFAAGQNPLMLLTADFDGNGTPDVAVVNHVSKDVTVYSGNGDGTLIKRSELPVGDKPFAAYSGDFDRDSKKDLAVVNHDLGRLSIFIGDGTGNFRHHEDINVDDKPHWISGGDFDLDGKQDLAVPHWGYKGDISILLGRSRP